MRRVIGIYSALRIAVGGTGFRRKSVWNGFTPGRIARSDKSVYPRSHVPTWECIPILPRQLRYEFPWSIVGTKIAAIPGGMTSVGRVIALSQAPAWERPPGSSSFPRPTPPPHILNQPRLARSIFLDCREARAS